MTLDEFFDAVEAYWAQADEHEGFRTSPGVLMMLRAIRASQQNVDKRPEDKNATNRPYKSGYLPERRLLWIRRRELTRLAKTIGMPDYARDFVGEDDAFVRLTTAFAMSGNVDSPDQRGVVLVGKSDERKTSKEILWIGITNELDIARLTLEERAGRLRSPISRYPARERLGWVRHVDLDNAIPSFGRDVLHDVAAELLKAELTPVVNGVDLLPAQEDFEARPAIWYPPSGMDELAAVLGDDSRIVYVVGTKSFDELRGIITDFLTAHPAAARNQFIVVDRERLADELSHAPWLWSKHAGATRGFVVCATSDLGDALGIRFFAVHPVADDYNFQTTPSLTRVVGRFGAGRSAVLTQICHGFSDTVAIVLRSTVQEHEVAAVESMLHSLPTDVFVVLDDAELYGGALAAHLARLARACIRPEPVRRLLVAYSSTARLDIARELDATRRLLGDDTLDINAWSGIAFSTVSTAARSLPDVHLDDPTIAALRLCESTPRIAADWVQVHAERKSDFDAHDAFLNKVQRRLDRWQDAYERLNPLYQDVVRVIAAFRCLLHWSELPLMREMVADAVLFMSGHTAPQTFRAFRDLVLDGWLEETGQGFRIDDICLFTPVVELLDATAGAEYWGQRLFDPLLWRFIDWLPEGSRWLGLAERDAALSAAALLLRYCEPDVLQRKAVIARILAERPAQAAHSTFVDILIEQGALAEAIAYVEREGTLTWEPKPTLPAILQILDTRQCETGRIIASIESMEESNQTVRLKRACIASNVRLDSALSPEAATLFKLLERHHFVPLQEYTRDGALFLQSYLDSYRRKCLPPELGRTLRALRTSRFDQALTTADNETEELT